MNPGEAARLAALSLQFPLWSIRRAESGEKDSPPSAAVRPASTAGR